MMVVVCNIHPPFLIMLGLIGCFLMSGICTFFGHRDCPCTEEIENNLKQAIKKLINEGYDEFWVGSQGNFDWLVHLVLKQIKQDFPHIRECIILASDPDKYSSTRLESLREQYDDIICPEEIFEGPAKFAITRRNKYMVENCDAVICYIEYEKGGAYDTVKTANKLNKRIFNTTNYNYN